MHVSMAGTVCHGRKDLLSSAKNASQLVDEDEEKEADVSKVLISR